MIFADHFEIVLFKLRKFVKCVAIKRIGYKYKLDKTVNG